MVVKMAKIMKSRRLRKRVRKTLGALFLASAVAVAAIPVDDLQASGEGTSQLKVTVGQTESNIPTLESNEKVYATGDGVFQFAYVSNDSKNPHAGTRNAVIVGYNPPNSLEGNTLEIPNEVEVYDLFTSNLGSGGRGYVAVGRAGNFLFWKKDTPVLDPLTGLPTYEQKEVTEKRTFYVLTNNTEVMVDEWSSAKGDRKPKMVAVLDENGKPTYDSDGKLIERQDVDKDGNPVWETVERDVTVKVDDLQKPIVTSEYLPCYYSDKNEKGWGEYELRDFYSLKDKDSKGNTLDYNNYDSKNPDHFEQVGDNSEKQWIIHVAVAHIASQSVSIDSNNVTTISDWITPENSATIKGVFQGKSGNVVNLKVGENLIGIGNYAFADCSSLQSITLSNGLRAIGNHAFDGCINIQQINTDPHSNLEKIGDHAFYNCQSLRAFNVPISVKMLGDGVFENCYALAEIGLHSESEIKALKTIGDHAFMNCRSLTHLTIPSNVTSDKLELSMVYGCNSLQSVTVINEQANFVEGTVPGESTKYTFDMFKKSVPSTFYFEGVNRALTGDTPVDGLHKTANENNIAFKYLNEDVYEIVVKDPDDTTGNRRAIYRVNSKNQLIYCHLDDGMSNVIMPSTIGPYRITSISSNSFQNNCALKKITIPSSVLTIDENAFKGCHHLEHVIFESPVQCKIGANAFKTQEATIHQTGCNGILATGSDVKLTFTGDISYASGPFDYAMNPSNNINVANQERTYIKYYSGWPTNLTVQYNPDTDKNELIDYPTFADLSSTTPVFTAANYPYITEEYEAAAKEALTKYNKGDTMTENERAIINAALNIELPQGIEAVKNGLFVSKEKDTEPDKTITTRGIAEIPANTFEGCKSLKSVFILGETSSIGDHAFKDCEKLETVEISSNVNSMGVRPFAGCANVKEVSFQDGPNFDCIDSIIYGLNGGQKSTVVECLEARGKSNGSTYIKSDEMAGVIGIAKEAFYNTNVGIVDLSESSITEVPEYAFAGDSVDQNSPSTNNLFAVYLPKTCQQIKVNAFKNSKISMVDIPASVSYIDPDAFNTTGNSPKDVATDTTDPNDTSKEHDGIYRDDCHTIEFSCENPSTAYMYATSPSNGNINPIDKPLVIEFEVTFVAPKDPSDPVGDYDTLDIQKVVAGEDAVPPDDKLPVFEGYTFQGWYPSYEEIGKDIIIEARYRANDLEESKFTVTFMDDDGVTELGTERVFPGEDAKGFVPTKEGYRFVGWVPPITNITQDTTVIAKYEKIDSDEGKYTINFYAWNEETGKNDKLIYTHRLAPGETIPDIRIPERPGYTFTGWLPDISEITKDLDTYAQYEYTGPGAPTPTPDPNATPGPTPDPNATATPVPGPGATATPVPGPGATATPVPGASATPGPTNPPAQPAASPTPSPSPAPGIFTLTVRNGSGSGSYIEGAQVIVIADNPSNNSEFSGWTVEPATALVASKDAMGTVLIMPASNVVMTANYRSKTNSSTVSRPSGNTGNNSNNTNNNNETSTNSGNGTTLVITKNGISNTKGTASVTVNGSSDNFVVKISEDANATEAALTALMNEYGDLTKISYFPMDISLYDSTGTTKITDTTGLAVDITLPIPDSLIPYAGNNKVAGVVNNRLDKLTPRFTTINGVPCISFTATHFSPYVIYVDTTDLSAGTIQDSTPKTGDGIHPKWFLAMGLACISFMLFIKKDKRAVPVKAKTAR